MSRIPFIEVRFFDPAETRYALEQRFERFLRDLRSGKLRPEADTAEEADYPDDDENTLPSLDEAPVPILKLGGSDQSRIKRRAARLLERRKSASGLDHLKKEDRDRLEVLKDGAALITIPSEHRADELAAELHADMPWMGPATEIVWQAMRRSVREGWPGLRLPPLLLDGPPGIGKSHWARRLGEVIGVPATVVEATGENASFGVVGCQRGWGAASPGRLIETVLRTRIANPVMVIDEVEKAGTATSTTGLAFGLAEALLPLLEPLTAKRWSCPYYQVRFDMSWVIWVLTSNDFRKLPGPLLSRCPPVRLQELTHAQVVGFARRQGRRRGLSEVSIVAITEVLAHPANRHRQLSLRTVNRMLDRAATLEAGSIQH